MQIYLSLSKLLVFGFLFGALLSGCQPVATPSSESGATINLVQSGALADTQAIEVLARQADESGEYDALATIADQETISQIISLLDVDLAAQPALFCVEQYRLHFQLVDGTVVEFAYVCADGEGNYLQGPAFMDGQAVEPPAALLESIVPEG